MRIIQLTPGTGNFYCGSCLRDNALVRGLRARGHDALMVPLYLPVVVDEPSASEGVPIFLSGLSVYFSRKFNVPAWLDRALSSPSLLRLAAGLAGMTSAKNLGKSTVEMLSGGHGEIERLITWLHTQPAPDVICLSNSLLAGLAPRLRQEFQVPIVSSLQGEDSFLDALPEPYRLQAWQLLHDSCSDIDYFIAVSRYHADQMIGRLALKSDRVAVVYPGIDQKQFAPAPTAPAVPTIGYLARLHPCKGLDLLVNAFIELRVRERVSEVRLRVAGSQTFSSRQYVGRFWHGSRANWLRGRLELLPNIKGTAKPEFLRSLSVFCVPADKYEAFPHFLLEALASGIPVVAPQHASFPELLEATGGVLLCEPDNPVALADTLETLLLDPVRARQLGEVGRQAVREKFSVEAMSANVETVLQKVIHAG